MGGSFLGEEKKYNPYSLFLILILLILSKDVLQIIIDQKLKNTENRIKKGKDEKKRLRLMPIAEKIEVIQTKREPKEVKEEK